MGNKFKIKKLRLKQIKAKKKRIKIATKYQRRKQIIQRLALGMMEFNIEMKEVMKNFERRIEEEKGIKTL